MIVVVFRRFSVVLVVGTHRFFVLASSVSSRKHHHTSSAVSPVSLRWCCRYRCIGLDGGGTIEGRRDGTLTYHFA